MNLTRNFWKHSLKNERTLLCLLHILTVFQWHQRGGAGRADPSFLQGGTALLLYHLLSSWGQMNYLFWGGDSWGRYSPILCSVPRTNLTALNFQSQVLRGFMREGTPLPWVWWIRIYALIITYFQTAKVLWIEAPTCTRKVTDFLYLVPTSNWSLKINPFLGFRFVLCL